MSEASVKSTAENKRALASVSDNALRIVLFGVPDSGKSILLGALAQAGRSPDKNALPGRLIDVSGRLEAMRQTAYENEPNGPTEEIIALPIQFESKEDGRQALPVNEAVIYDCDGRLANEIVSSEKTLQNAGPAQLSKTILDADVLILTVDISSSAEVLNRNFNQFVKFIPLLEESRSKHGEVNGFPVYLVLTKCDLLARSDDTFTDWVDRVEERKQTVNEEFRRFLAEKSSDRSLPFGKINLDVWATAKQRPALGGAAAKGKEPYQVAELFRQSLDSAIEFRRQRKQAQRRLHLTVAGILLLTGAMAALAIFFLIGRQGAGSVMLEDRIRTYFTNYDTTDVERLARWQQNIDGLRRLQKNDYFGQISSGLQSKVSNEAEELAAYGKFQKELTQAIELKDRRPNQIYDESTLEETETILKEIRPPPKYASSWRGAEALVRRENWLEDFRNIKVALEKTRKDYKSVVNEGKEVLKVWNAGSITVADGKKKAGKLLAKGAKLPQKTKDSAKHIPNSKRITYANILEFPSIKVLYREWWEYTEGELKKIVSK